MSESFRKALSFHIQNTTLRPPRHRPSAWDALGTLLVMALALGLIVAIGMR